MTLTEIIYKYGVANAEKALVYCYLNANNIDKEAHPFIADYLSNVEISEILINDIASLNHNSLAELAVDMELLIPDEDRKTNGAFFTPQYIVDYIINEIHPTNNAKVIDISCGSGAFLLGILRYYNSKLKKKVTDIVNDNLFGVDLLEYNITRSKILIILFGLSVGEIVNIDSINVVADNSLTRNWNQKFDVVVGNPPYVKFQDMDADTRDMLQDKYKTTNFGTYNLYFAFFEIGLQILTDDGVLGYITPNNYFTSLSGQSLRCFFMDTHSVSKIVDFNSTKVFDVQTYTAISFLTKKQNDFILYSRISSGETPSSYISSCNFTENNYKDLNAKKWRLLAGNEREIISRLENCGTPIGKLFDIAVGIATLKDEAYFIDIIGEDNLFYHCKNKFCEDFFVEKNITRPLVKISTIKKQEQLPFNKRRIIFPYLVDKGQVTIIEEDTIQEKYPECYKYLNIVKPVLQGRGKGKESYSPFYRYGRSQGLNRSGEKIYTPTFSQYPRFIYDECRSSLFTNGYALFFRENEEPTLFGDVSSFNPIVPENKEAILKILNSGLMHFYVKKTSVSIEGGYPCYQKNFIENFSIPEMTMNDYMILSNLSDQKEIDEFLMDKYQIKCPIPNLWE